MRKAKKKEKNITNLVVKIPLEMHEKIENYMATNVDIKTKAMFMRSIVRGIILAYNDIGYKRIEMLENRTEFKEEKTVSALICEFDNRLISGICVNKHISHKQLFYNALRYHFEVTSLITQASIVTEKDYGVAE